MRRAGTSRQRQHPRQPLRIPPIMWARKFALRAMRMWRPKFTPTTRTPSWEAAMAGARERPRELPTAACGHARGVGWWIVTKIEADQQAIGEGCRRDLPGAAMRGAHPNFERSPHGKAGVGCTTCRSVRIPVIPRAKLLKASQPGLCFTRHAGRQAGVQHAAFHHKRRE